MLKRKIRTLAVIAIAIVAANAFTSLGATGALAASSAPAHAMLAADTSFASAVPASAAVISHPRPAVAAAPDTSYPPIYNSLTAYLTNDPVSTDPSICRLRTGINLKAGTYAWILLFTDYFKEPYLATGTYDWEYCIYPENDALTGPYYIDVSVLCPTSFKSGCINLAESFVLDNPGTYTIGSELYLLG